MSTPLRVGRAAKQPDTIAPDGSEIRLLSVREHGATRASLCEVRLGPGSVSRPIAHRSVEEIWYVLQGRGKLWRSPPDTRLTPVDLTPGDSVVIPRGWHFQFSADADGELRFLCYTSPPWPGPDEALPVELGGLGQPTV